MSRQNLNRFLSIIIVFNILITRNIAVPILEEFKNRSSSTFNGKKDIITNRFEIINSKIISTRSSRGKILHPRELVTILGGIATTVVSSALAAGIAPFFGNIGKSLVGGDEEEEELAEEPSEPDEFDEDQDQEPDELDQDQLEYDEESVDESYSASAFDMKENVDEDRPTKKFGKIGE